MIGHAEKQEHALAGRAVSGMARRAPRRVLVGGAGRGIPSTSPRAADLIYDAWRIVIPPSEIEYSFASSS